MIPCNLKRLDAYIETHSLQEFKERAKKFLLDDKVEKLLIFMYQVVGKKSLPETISSTMKNINIMEFIKVETGHEPTIFDNDKLTTIGQIEFELGFIFRTSGEWPDVPNYDGSYIVGKSFFILMKY